MYIFTSSCAVRDYPIVSASLMSIHLPELCKSRRTSRNLVGDLTAPASAIGFALQAPRSLMPELRALSVGGNLLYYAVSVTPTLISLSPRLAAGLAVRAVTRTARARVLLGSSESIKRARLQGTLSFISWHRQQLPRLRLVRERPWAA